MSEKVDLNVASAESVALEMAKNIAAQEKMYSDESTYRKIFLDLYAECLEAVNNHRKI